MLSLNYFFLIYILLFTLNSSFAQPSPFGHKVQYIGNTRYVSPKDEQKRNWCGTFWCTNDAFYIFTKSSQYPDVDPCVDFKNFTINQAEEVDAVDDRVPYRGFQTLFYNKYLEQIRKVLAEKFNPEKDKNNRIVKIMKNTFRNCLRSPHVFRHLEAHQDIIEYIKEFGGSPYFTKHINFNPRKFNEKEDYRVGANHGKIDGDDLWNENDFDMMKIFQKETYHAMKIFLQLQVGRCKFSDNDDREILCLKKSNNWGWNDKVFNNFKDFFFDLEDSYIIAPQLREIMIDKMIKPAMENYKENFERIQRIFNRNYPIFSIVPIRKLNEITAKYFDLNWVEIINNMLLEESKINETNFIMVQGGVELFQNLIKDLAKTKKVILADTFVVSFLYLHRFSIILRFHNHQILEQYGTKHASQRWRTCIFTHILPQMHPALLVMYERWRPVWDRFVGDFNRDIHDERSQILTSAEKFSQEAIDELKQRFTYETDLKPSIAIDVLDKLKNLKIVVSLTEKYLSFDQLDDFYKELNLNGSENFLKSVWELDNHHMKILNEPRDNWRRKIDEMVNSVGGKIQYKINEGNILYIPPVWVVYPHYHPLRPRFFNMATIFKEVIAQAIFGVNKYIKNKWNLKDFTIVSSDNVEIAYESYKKWLTNNTEMDIGANYLTSLQLYWVTLSFTLYAKYHRTVPSHFNPINRLQHEYLHVYYKNNKGFQEAFSCNMTNEEWEKLNEYKMKLSELTHKT